MTPYSIDLRERVVKAVKEKKMSKSAVAKHYEISRATVYRYLELDETDDLAPRVHPGHPRDLDEAGCQKLVKQVEKYPDLNLEEQAEKFAQEQQIELGKSSLWNYFERLGIRRKKNATGSGT
jgi:putative transposase